MAFTEKQLKGYGLSPTDKQGHPDNGIVSDGQGNYYKIDDFDRNQKEGLDEDEGKVFGSSLYDDAKKTGFSVTTFNTGSDVQGALQALAAGFDAIEDEPVEDNKPYVPSDIIQASNDLVDSYEGDILSGKTSAAIFRDNKGNPVAKNSEDQRNSVFDKYKFNIKADYKPSIQSLLNAEAVATGAP